MSRTRAKDHRAYYSKGRPSMPLLEVNTCETCKCANPTLFGTDLPTTCSSCGSALKQHEVILKRLLGIRPKENQGGKNKE